MKMGQDIVVVGTCCAVGANYIDVRFTGFYLGEKVTKVRVYHPNGLVRVTPQRELVLRLKTICLVNEVLEASLIKLKMIE